MASAEIEIINKVHETFRSKGLKLVVVESCTAGLLSHMMAGVPGRAEFLEAAIVCHSVDAANRLLGVRNSVLKEHGPVSEELAIEMAKAAEDMAGADVALSLSCGLEPGADEDRNPSIVYLAVSSGKESTSRGFMFEGTPEEIRRSASEAALRFLYEAVSLWT